MSDLCRTAIAERDERRARVVEWLRAQLFTWVAPCVTDGRADADALDVLATVAGQSVGILIGRPGEPVPERRTHVLAAMSAAGGVGVTVNGLEEVRLVHERIMRNVLHRASCGMPGRLRLGVCRYCWPSERTAAAYDEENHCP